MSQGSIPCSSSKHRGLIVVDQVDEALEDPNPCCKIGTSFEIADLESSVAQAADAGYPVTPWQIREPRHELVCLLLGEFPGGVGAATEDVEFDYQGVGTLIRDGTPGHHHQYRKSHTSAGYHFLSVNWRKRAERRRYGIHHGD